MEKEEYQKMYAFENEYWWYRGLHQLVESWVKKIHSGRPLAIFDAGCGTGRMLEILAPYGNAEGIDYSPEAVELCRQRGLAQVTTGDLNTWTPQPDIYDIIVSNDVVCTSGVIDDVEVLKQCLRALKPGGYFISNFPAFDCLRRNHDIAVSGKRRYRKNKTVALITSVGFDVVRAHYRLPALFPIILLQKMFDKPFQKGQEITSDLKPLPGFINWLLFGLNTIENKMSLVGFPTFFGSSLFLICRKPLTEA